MGTLQQAEQAAAGVSKGAPRVTLADIEAEIVDVCYLNGATFYERAMKQKFTQPVNLLDIRCLTLCLCITKSGFMVVGKSAPASPDNFDAELGRKLAYEDAVRQLWPLMGFALKDRLRRAEQTAGSGAIVSATVGKTAPADPDVAAKNRVLLEAAQQFDHYAANHWDKVVDAKDDSMAYAARQKALANEAMAKYCRDAAG